MNKFVVTQDGNCAINANNTCLFYKKAEVDSKFSINALLTNGQSVSVALYDSEADVKEAYRRLLDFLEVTGTTNQEVYYINSRPDGTF